MGEVAEKNQQLASNFTRQVAETVARILAILADYLEKEQKNAAQKELARYIRGGGMLFSYSVQGDKAGAIPPLKAELIDKGIPFGETNEGDKILIRYDDLNLIKGINHDILVAKGNYYQEADASELERAVATAPFIKDKEILSIKDLNTYQYEVLKNKCNDISQGFMIGRKEKENGLFDVSVQAKDVLTDDAEKKDFCLAYLQMYMSLYGPNCDTKISQIEADKKIDEEVAKLKGTKAPHYIVGVDDPTRYIEITEERFVYHRFKKVADAMQEEQSSCDVKDPDYEAELQRAMDQIFNRAIISDPELLHKHLQSKERIIESERPRRDVKQFANHMAEKDVSEKIDEMIKERIKNEGIGFSSAAMKFDFYVKEASVILSSAIDGIIPAEYKEESLLAIKEAFDKREVSMDAYKQIPEQMLDVKHESHLAMEKRRNIQVVEKKEEERT